MSILIKQIASAFFLLVGLISSLSWYEWKESPLWMLLVGIFFTLSGVVGVVLTIVQSEDELEDFPEIFEELPPLTPEPVAAPVAEELKEESEEEVVEEELVS